MEALLQNILSQNSLCHALARPQPVLDLSDRLSVLAWFINLQILCTGSVWPPFKTPRVWVATTRSKHRRPPAWETQFFQNKYSSDILFRLLLLEFNSPAIPWNPSHQVSVRFPAFGALWKCRFFGGTWCEASLRLAGRDVSGKSC